MNSYVMQNSIEIVSKLTKEGLHLVNEGFGYNARALTSYPQYVIYLAEIHMEHTEADLQAIIEATLSELKVDTFQEINFRGRGGKTHRQLWCFVRRVEPGENKNRVAVE